MWGGGGRVRGLGAERGTGARGWPGRELCVLVTLNREVPQAQQHTQHTARDMQHATLGTKHTDTHHANTRHTTHATHSSQHTQHTQHKQLRYVAAALVRLYARRHTMGGLRRTYATPLLSHFTARFEPIAAIAADGAATAAADGCATAADVGGVADGIKGLLVGK
jgi:hypothetical protein